MAVNLQFCCNFTDKSADFMSLPKNDSLSQSYGFTDYPITQILNVFVREGDKSEGKYCHDCP